MTAELLLVIVTFCGQPTQPANGDHGWTQKDRNICVSSILSCVETEKGLKFKQPTEHVAKCLVRP